jgi:hypothetical protein
MEDLKGTLVEVIWDDASWWPQDVSDPEALEDECLVHTFGIVVRQSEKSLFVASEYNRTNDQAKAVTRVPFPYIVDLHGLSHAPGVTGCPLLEDTPEEDICLGAA